MTAAELDLHTIPTLQLVPPTIFEIKTWTPNRITAIREHPCGTATLTVDVDAQNVTITSVLIPTCHFAAKNRLTSGTWSMDFQWREHLSR
jgi:hypothetical protein